MTSALTSSSPRADGTYALEDLERVRAQWIAGIAQEKTQPVGLALRTLPPSPAATAAASAVTLPEAS